MIFLMLGIMVALHIMVLNKNIYLFNEDEDEDVKDIRYLFNEDEDNDVDEDRITYKESPFKSIIVDIRNKLSKNENKIIS